MSSPNGFDIGDYFEDNKLSLVGDFVQRFPEVWINWLDVKYGDKPEPESSYVDFLNDEESPEFKEFSDWAVSYIREMLENDYPEADNTEGV